jgi:hypothetical protein
MDLDNIRRRVDGVIEVVECKCESYQVREIEPLIV